MSGVGKRFLALGSGEIVARILSFAATIYLARTLSPALYGIFGVISGVMLYLHQVADAGIELAGIPLIASDRAQAATLTGAILTHRTIAAAILSALTIVVSLTFLPAPESQGLAIAAIGLVATGMSTRWVLLGLEQAGAVAMTRTLGELAGLALILVAIRSSDDLLWAPAALALSVSVTSLAALGFLTRRGFTPRWRWDARAARPTLQRSRPLVVFTLLGLLLFNFDLIFLRVITGAAEAGLYAAAYTFVALGANVIVAFAHTLLPTLVRADVDRPKAYQTAWAQAFSIALPAGVGLSLVAPQLIAFVFGTSYQAGAPALQLLALTIPLAAMRELPVVALLASGRENRLVRVNAITAAANVALVMAVVPSFGLAGAAAATVVTEILRLYTATRYASQAGMASPRLARLWRPTVSTLAMGGMLVVAPELSLWSAIALGGGSFGLAMLLLGALRFEGRIPHLRV